MRPILVDRLRLPTQRDAVALVALAPWAAWAVWPRLPIGIVIDHVLVDRRAHVTDASVERIPGSDHRALLVTLSLPTS